MIKQADSKSVHIVNHSYEHGNVKTYTQCIIWSQAYIVVVVSRWPKEGEEGVRELLGWHPIVENCPPVMLFYDTDVITTLLCILHCDRCRKRGVKLIPLIVYTDHSTSVIHTECHDRSPPRGVVRRDKITIRDLPAITDSTPKTLCEIRIRKLFSRWLDISPII